MSSAPLAEFGRYIRELRESKQWSREHLEEFGISKSTVERWENGEISRPRRSTFEQFARAFDLNVDDFIKRYKNSIASDTVQAANCPPGNDITFTSTPGDVTEFTMPSRIERQPRSWRVLFEAIRGRRVVYLVIAAVVFLLMLAVFMLMITSWTKSNKVTISGNVLCADNERVVGVWVSAVSSGSNFANWYKTNSNGSEAAFWYVLPNGGAYNLHIGCGGSRQDWDNTDYTENGSSTIKDHSFHYFTCQDVPLVAGHGPCYLKQ